MHTQARQLTAQSRTHSPKFFEKTETQWVYRHANFTPWNTGSEACEVMHDGIITSVGPEKAAGEHKTQICAVFVLNSIMGELLRICMGVCVGVSVCM